MVIKAMDEFKQLQKKVEQLTSLAEQAKATGEGGKPGDISGKATAWVNEAIRQLDQIIWNLKDTLDVRAMEYGPGQAASVLRQIATAIDNSKNPRRDWVVEDIQKVIAAIK
jgi:hypothetical protein